MATLDSLAGDQRAVLQLVLGRGRSYDEIARLLSINRESVRARALSALDALGPQTTVPDVNRRLVCDYLLGQLDESEVLGARELLAHSAGERAWARVLHSELAPLASGPLPEIPSDAGPPPPAPGADAPAPPVASPEPSAVAADAAEAPQRRRWSGVRARARRPRPAREPVPAGPAPDGGDERARSSRRGGMVLIGLVVIVVVAVVLVLALHHGSSGSNAASAPTTTAVTTNPASSTATATTSASGTGSARIITQINLSPTTPGSTAAAIADVLQEGATREIAIVGQNVPANTAKNSYAVWLYNSPSSAVRLGFVSPGVTANGKLSAAGPLPSNAGDYKELIVTTETSAHPKAPGPILLQGTVTGLS